MEKLFLKAQQLYNLCRDKNIKITTAESCTAGLLGYAITSVAGSSAIYDGGFVTYSYDLKEKLLNVKDIEKNGAVSFETAKQMSINALAITASDVAISITGIAGPDGGMAEKPVGTVMFSLADKQGSQEYKEHFEGDRDDVRIKSVNFALDKLIETMSS